MRDHRMCRPFVQPTSCRSADHAASLPPVAAAAVATGGRLDPFAVGCGIKSAQFQFVIASVGGSTKRVTTI
jgi:hypothetical protein